MSKYKIDTIEQWLGADNKLGIDIWNKKYRYNNESFSEWVERVSGGDERLAQMILEKKFLFGGRILATRGINDGTKYSYSNCYVITPPEDNLESIYDTCKRLARTYSWGGGCGIDISKLAPEGAHVHNQARTSSGAVSFMDTFSQVTQQIGQRGRRGALMISIDCRHPDLEKFIKIKNDLNKVNYANISVRVTDDFMKAVINDGEWELKFCREETGETISKKVKAKEIFRMLCESNWNYAEPGILFWDTINGYNLQSENSDFSFAGTNPCAEEPLPDSGSCLLGSLNLSEFVYECDGKSYFNHYEFGRCVDIAVSALNKVQRDGINRHPLKEQRECAEQWRQIGLGIMGLADMLIKLGLTYGSPEALEVCEEVGKSLACAALRSSANYAEKHGSYPAWSNRVLLSSFLNKHVTQTTPLWWKIKGCGLANSQLLTIAPTGTLSTMLGISGGIEPIFANSYTRTTKTLHDGKDVTYKVYTPIVKEYMDKHGLKDESELPKYFITAGQIPINDRIKTQAVWQRHIDASISSTINLPNEATVEDVESLYISAWEHGLKGITVYRAGCAREGILNTEAAKPKENEKPRSYEPIKNVGLERHITTGCGSLHICAFFDENGNLKNTYLSKGSTGGCNNFMIGLSRMISLAARNGVDIKDIVDQLNSCGSCPSYAVRRATRHDTSVGSCCPVAIGNALKDMWREANYGADYKKTVGNLPDKCPECGGALKHEMGCVTCINCGYSKCG